MRKNIGSYFFTLKGGGAYDPDQVRQAFKWGADFIGGIVNGIRSIISNRDWKHVVFTNFPKILYNWQGREEPGKGLKWTLTVQ